MEFYWFLIVLLFDTIICFLRMKTWFLNICQSRLFVSFLLIALWPIRTQTHRSNQWQSLLFSFLSISITPKFNVLLASKQEFWFKICLFLFLFYSFHCLQHLFSFPFPPSLFRFYKLKNQTSTHKLGHWSIRSFLVY